ncbi:MAG TPA: hypothetical protein VK689_02760 [Armatimonadota bacterium]|nr:hypothetical protein [Armatimonadota bacterium]
MAQNDSGGPAESAKPRHIYLHSEDLDGWLSVPNQPLAPRCTAFLRRFQGLTLETSDALHGVQVVLNSGKAPDYLEAEARRFGGEHVISGNGAAWRRCGGPTHRFAPFTRDLLTLRRLLGISANARDVVRLALPSGEVEAALEDKRDAEGDIVLSLFPEPAPVAHRWSFRGGCDRHTLRTELVRLIQTHGLALHVPPPHRDGAVDVLPLVDGRPVGKWALPLLSARMFPGAVLHLAHGGDAINDLSAMEAEGVIPLTAANCTDTVEIVRREGGVVAGRAAPEGGAAIECYGELARRGFYGPLSERVARLCEEHLRAWDA